MFGSMKRKRKSFGRNNKDTNTATFHTTLALQKGHGKTKKVEEDFDSIFHGGEKEGCGKEEETGEEDGLGEGIEWLRGVAVATFLPVMEIYHGYQVLICSVVCTSRRHTL